MTDKLSVVARAIHFTLFPHLPERMFDTDARHRQHLCDTAKAAIEAHLKALEEQGLVIVPREPTIAMDKAGHQKMGFGNSAVWQAMLAALEGKP